MTFAELSGYLDRLESTSSRNELVKTLAELYAKSSPDEIQPLTYLIQGRLVPFFEPIEIGLGEPRWQELQVTICFDSKLSRLMPAIICIIFRAVCLGFLSSFSRAPSTWQ